MNQNQPSSVVRAVARYFLACFLFFAFLPAADACWGKKEADFSSYDTPLYQQIVGRIQDKILARLGEGKNKKDRYFIIPFAYQNQGNNPKYSHSFMTVIRVFADQRQISRTKGLKERVHANRKFEAFNISWMPADFAQNADLCVFKGFGARLVPQWNTCPVSSGRSFSLEETIKLGVSFKNAVCMWGPYEITKEGFGLGVQRLRLLESGKVKYRADDRLTRKDHSAINCFHAMAGLTKLYPDGGIFGTGFMMWGINGTARVLTEYKKAAGFKGLLLEPVNEKEDRHGFVYVESRTAKFYDPFKTTAAAYH